LARIRGILFDKDGTLVDFQRTWYAIGDMMALKAAGGDRRRANALMAEAGYDYDASGFRADSVFAAGTNADIVNLWYPHLAADARKAMIAHFDTVTAEEGALQAIALSGIKETLAALHASGYRLGLCTNDSTGGAEKTLLALSVAQLFDAAYGYDAVANPKPAPDAVYAFCDLTGLRPAEVAMVGDNGHDLEMARAAGAGLAVGVLSGTGTRASLASLADAVLNSVIELPALLKRRDAA
jgi:phosphoglycolate phosphatase